MGPLLRVPRYGFLNLPQAGSPQITQNPIKHGIFVTFMQRQSKLTNVRRDADLDRPATVEDRPHIGGNPCRRYFFLHRPVLPKPSFFREDSGSSATSIIPQWVRTG